MEDELQRLVRMFSNGNAAADVGTEAGAAAFALGYAVTPMNLATGEPLAKPQLLSGPAAMAAHALLMKVHAKKLVRACTWQQLWGLSHATAGQLHSRCVRC